MVVWYHLVEREFAGPVAVFGFYALSGYLMTKVVNEIYGDGLAGFGRYVANRALRIYPAYYAALGLSALVVLVLPDAALRLFDYYTWPASPLTELAIFGHVPRSHSLLLQTWSLGVELVYYLLIGAVLGRGPRIALVWFLASLALVSAALIEGSTRFSWYYFSIPASSLPFSVGAVLYHWRNRMPPMPTWIAPFAVVAIVTVGLLMPRDFGKAGGIYVGLAIATLAIAALSRRRPRRLDALLGDLAYPVFLLHIPAGAVAVAILGGKTALAALLATLITLVLAGAVILLVERPIGRIRDSVRRRVATVAPS